jgi:hypothetical protein
LIIEEYFGWSACFFGFDAPAAFFFGVLTVVAGVAGAAAASDILAVDLVNHKLHKETGKQAPFFNTFKLLGNV